MVGEERKTIYSYGVINAQFEEAKHICTWLHYDNIIYHLRQLRTSFNKDNKDFRDSLSFK